MIYDNFDFLCHNNPADYVEFLAAFRDKWGGNIGRVEIRNLREYTVRSKIRYQFSAHNYKRILIVSEEHVPNKNKLLTDCLANVNETSIYQVAHVRSFFPHRKYGHVSRRTIQTRRKCLFAKFFVGFFFTILFRGAENDLYAGGSRGRIAVT